MTLNEKEKSTKIKHPKLRATRRLSKSKVPEDKHGEVSLIVEPHVVGAENQSL